MADNKTVWRLIKNPVTEFETNIIPTFPSAQNATTTLDSYGEWSCKYSKAQTSSSQWLASNAFDRNNSTVVKTSGCGQIKEYIQLDCPAGVKIHPDMITFRCKHSCDYTVAPYFDMYIWTEGYDAATDTWEAVTNEQFMQENNNMKIYEFSTISEKFYSKFRFYLQSRTSVYSYIDYGMIYDIEMPKGQIRKG